ncbi:hypothetical protein [Gilliamella sp. B2772]|nr:hypothetical protein [Gilliamella sp. B2772]
MDKITSNATLIGSSLVPWSTIKELIIAKAYSNFKSTPDHN